MDYVPTTPRQEREMLEGLGVESIQALYEFQSMASRLTGMDLANASLYDASTGLAEAAIMGPGNDTAQTDPGVSRRQPVLPGGHADLRALSGRAHRQRRGHGWRSPPHIPEIHPEIARGAPVTLPVKPAGRIAAGSEPGSCLEGSGGAADV